MTHDRIAEAYEALVSARAPVTRDGCPPPEALMAVVTHEGPESDRLVTVNHAMGCAACRPELELLRSVALASARPPIVLRLAPLASLVAAIVVAIGIGVGLQRRSTSVERGVAQATAISPVGTVTGTPAFVWHRVPGAIDYRVIVATASGTPVRDTVTKDTILAPRAVEAGRDYYWLVRARLSDGTERATAPVRFRIPR
jgi:hypothetical protein